MSSWVDWSAVRKASHPGWGAQILSASMEAGSSLSHGSLQRQTSGFNGSNSNGDRLISNTVTSVLQLWASTAFQCDGLNWWTKSSKAADLNVPAENRCAYRYPGHMGTITGSIPLSQRFYIHPGFFVFSITSQFCPQHAEGKCFAALSDSSPAASPWQQYLPNTGTFVMTKVQSAVLYLIIQRARMEQNQLLMLLCLIKVTSCTCFVSRLSVRERL